MVSWTCTGCGGSGRSEVTIIRNGKMSQFEERCQECLGSGSIRNGLPEYTLRSDR